MNFSYQEVGYEAVTLPATNVEEGKLCKITENGVTKCEPGDIFMGMVEKAYPGYASVQIHGFVTCVYYGTVPTCGYVNLASNEAGGVRVNSAGRSYLVVDVNKSRSTVTFEL